LTPAAIAEEISTAVKMAKAENYKASGLFEASWSAKAIANSEKLFAFDRFSNLNYSATMHGPLGSGFSSQNAESVSRINAESLARRALKTAKNAQNPQPVEPGEYTVIFEPHAVADLLGFMTWNMSARDADEGTTVFAGRVGQRLFNERVSIETKIDDPELPAPPFGPDGLSARRTVWVHAGVVERLRHDRYWASQKKTDPDPLFYPLFMDGQEQSFTDLIARCKKGLLVKRLWYIRYVDRKELLLTGMTRDGLFLIENGRIIHPVTNLRFNESPVVFLQNVIAMSRPKRVEDWAKVPGVMSEGFTFSSKTESV
jgi:predicted Zn-dependent protease